MKKIISIIISMILLLSCVACGDTSGSTSEPASESTYTPSSDSSSETPDPEPGKDDGIDLSGQTTMSDTVKEANRLANGARGRIGQPDFTAQIYYFRAVVSAYARSLFRVVGFVYVVSKHYTFGLVTRTRNDYRVKH